MNAQQLPNSGFESWSSNKPTSWNTLSFNVGATLEIGTNALTSSTDAHGGTYALKVSISAMNPIVKGALQNLLPAEYQPFLETPVPGLATNGTVDLMTLLPVIMELVSGDGNLDPSLIMTLGNAIKDGMPLTQKPVALSGFGKADMKNAEDMIMAVVLVYSGTGDEREVIGFGFAPITEPTYEEFEAEISYINPAATPSELIALFVAFTTNTTAPAPYSSILIDDLSISYGAGLGNNKLSNVSVYPNPAKDVLNISTSATQYEIEVVDMLGRVVITENSKPTINISDLTKGVYFVKVTQNGTTNTEKIVVE
jgi:hypothetical protein